jgi:flagellar export protein FliJ
MPFIFSLAAVLQFRQNLERQQYLALEKIHQEIAHLETQLVRIEEWRKAAAQQREADLKEGVPAMYLQGDFQQELSLEQYRDILQSKLRDLRTKRQQHLKIYEKARQKREVLEELRTRKLAVYTREQGKREQSRIDDLFLARRKRGE